MTKAFVDTSVILRLLIKDDTAKVAAGEKLIKNAKQEGVLLYLLPVTFLEIVWVLEKVYRLERRKIRELIEAILNTPELRCELESVFRQAIVCYTERNMKFADAVMGFWGMENGFTSVFTYDEKDFKKIPGLTVKKP